MNLYVDAVDLRCQVCSRDFVGPAYGYPRGKKRVGCFCGPHCAYRYVYDSDDRKKDIIMPEIKGEGATHLLPPPRLLTCFGGPLPYERWMKVREYWEAPLCPMPLNVCVLNDATFSNIRVPARKLGRTLFPSNPSIKGKKRTREDAIGRGTNHGKNRKARRS